MGRSTQRNGSRGLWPDFDRVRQDLIIAEARLRAYQARPGKPAMTFQERIALERQQKSDGLGPA